MGPFRLYESAPAQVDRLKAMRAETPGYANALMQQGQLLVKLVQQNRFASIIELVSTAREGELLFYFTARMFEAACTHHHTRIVRSLASRRGAACSRSVPWLHRSATCWTTGWIARCRA